MCSEKERVKKAKMVPSPLARFYRHISINRDLCMDLNEQNIYLFFCVDAKQQHFKHLKHLKNI